MEKESKLQIVRHHHQKADASLKYISLLILVLQNACQVLLMRHSRTRNKEELYLSTSAVFFTEFVKLFTCLFVICVQERSCLRCVTMIYDQIVKQPLDTVKVCVPALVYTLQNNLLYFAVSNLDAATFMVTYQLKILTTALFSVWMLRKPLSWPQWFSLVLLFGGISLVNLQEQVGSASVRLAGNESRNHSPGWNSTTPGNGSTIPSDQRDQNALAGLSAVVSACLLSGFGGIYFEKILKGSHISVWMRNVQLAVLALPISYITMMSKDGAMVNSKGVMYGYDGLVWLIVFVYALGGLTVAVVIKYADNILKGFATSAAIVFSCVASVFLFDFWPSTQFLLGTLLVMGAIYLYSKCPYHPPLD